MNQARKPIFDALETLMAGVSWGSGTKFKLVSQRMKAPNEVSQEQMPACFLYSPRESIVRQGERLPMATTLHVDIYIYFNSGQSPTAIPCEEVNLVLDAVDAAFKADLDPSRQVCTLGGLVSHCWVEGEIEKVPGDMDGIGLAIVPVHILVP